MKRLLLLLLPTLIAVGLTGCASDSDDDPFPVHSSAASDSDNPVAGAATPAKGDSSSGWKW